MEGLATNQDLISLTREKLAGLFGISVPTGRVQLQAGADGERAHGAR